MDDRVKVKFANGFETVLEPRIAKIYEKRGKVTILGAGKKAPPPAKEEKKKPDREALVKKAIELQLASKEDLVALSDSEIAALVEEA